MTHRFAPSLLLLRPLLVVVVVAALAGHYLDRSGTLAPAPKASVALQRLDVTPDGASANVVLRVAAGSEDLGPLSVFWIVALPDTARPWETPNYISRAETLDSLKAGTSADVVWRETQLAMPIGRYDVSGWVHQIMPTGDSVHLAGGLVGSFSITRPEPPARRFDPGWFSAPRGPLVLTDLSVTQVAPQSQTISVEATVANRGTDAVTGKAFWLVGRFTDPEPFADPFWQPNALAIPLLAPGQSQVVSWTQSVGLPAGTYGLSVWVHWDGPGGSAHSHSSLQIPVTLAPALTHVQRYRPPALMQVASATLPGAGLVRLIVDNEGPELRVSVDVAVVPEGRRYDWYQDVSEPEGTPLDFLIPSQSQQTIDVPVGVACTPDGALVRIRLYPSGDLSAANAPLDDALVDACP